MDNRLKLNLNLTRYMLFKSGKIDVQKNIDLDIKIGNLTISKVNIIHFWVLPLKVILSVVSILKIKNKFVKDNRYFIQNIVLVKSKF